MRHRWKVLTAACAVAMAMSGSAAVAHPPEDFGTQLSSPMGKNFWFLANFQTAANPANPANTHVTSSDIAFWDDLAYVGDYGGFRIFDISRPEPEPLPEATHEAHMRIGDVTLRVYTLADGRRLMHAEDVRRFLDVASREDLVAFMDLWRMMRGEAGKA